MIYASGIAHDQLNYVHYFPISTNKYIITSRQLYWYINWDISYHH